MPGTDRTMYISYNCARMRSQGNYYYRPQSVTQYSVYYYYPYQGVFRGLYYGQTLACPEDQFLGSLYGVSGTYSFDIYYNYACISFTAKWANCEVVESISYVQELEVTQLDGVQVVCPNGKALTSLTDHGVYISGQCCEAPAVFGQNTSMIVSGTDEFIDGPSISNIDYYDLPADMTLVDCSTDDRYIAGSFKFTSSSNYNFAQPQYQCLYLTPGFSGSISYNYTTVATDVSLGLGGFTNGPDDDIICPEDFFVRNIIFGSPITYECRNINDAKYGECVLDSQGMEEINSPSTWEYPSSNLYFHLYTVTCPAGYGLVAVKLESFTIDTEADGLRFQMTGKCCQAVPIDG